MKLKWIITLILAIGTFAVTCWGAVIGNSSLVGVGFFGIIISSVISIVLWSDDTGRY